MSLSEQQLREIWDRKIRRRIFRGAQRQESPTTVLLGGQPGAGKTKAAQMAIDRAGAQIVVLGVDNYRQFHPDYRRVIDEDPLRMPDVTAEAAGAWIQMCVDHAREQGYSILIEGTWRNAQVPLQAARAAAKDGRRVDAVVVAVQPEVSRLGTMERYYRDVLAGDDARWTPPAAHDAAVASLPGTVEAVAMSGDVASLSVVNRQGATLFHSDRPPSPERVEGAVTALHQGMTRALSPEEFQRYSASVKAMTGAHERLTVTDPQARSAWTQIKTHDEPLMSGRTAVTLAHIAQPADTLPRPTGAPTANPTRHLRTPPQPGRDLGPER